ncbi:MAG: hypothetical protein H6736_08540 [Alphaproteobacteria bacterium]|nr:hypothetical protein [Alphaproteobacteria bacterium]
MSPLVLALLSAPAIAGDNASIVAVLDGISDPVAGSNTYEGDADLWVFDLSSESFAVDCSGFVSYVVWNAWLGAGGYGDIDVSGKKMVSSSYTMNGIAGASNGNHGPFSADWRDAVSEGYILLDGVPHALDVRTSVTAIQRGDMMTRVGHVAFVDDLQRITDDFWVLDVVHAVSSSGVTRSTYYLGVETDGSFKYYSSSSKLRDDDSYDDVTFAGLGG